MSEVTQLITRELNEFDNYTVDQAAICRRDFLKCLTKSESDFEVASYKKTYIPYMFDPYTEDIDVESRYSKLQSSSFESLSWIPESKSNILFSFEKPPEYRDLYDEDEAEEKYLKSRPVSFFILSKPNVGEMELAKLLMRYWKCVLITPETVLREEIASDSRVGKCIKFNLQNGRSIGPEVLLRLAERRIKSQTASHRGFVLAGFPLIPNDFYKADPLSSESAVFNVEEIFEDIFIKYPPDFVETPSTMKGSKVSLDADKSSDVTEDVKHVESKKVMPPPAKKVDVDLGFESHSIINPSNESFACLSSVQDQINFLFDLIKQPTLFIYILCGNLDVVNKVDKYRFNLFSEKEISLLKDSVDTAFSPNLLSTANIFDLDEDDPEKEIDLKTVVKLPIHFKNSVSAQLKHFKYKLLPMIDLKVVEHNSQHFIKLDGRLSANRMFLALRPRLKTLGFQPVLVPQLMSETKEIEGEGEAEEAAASLTVQETFAKLRGVNVVSPMYKWQLSNWGYKCPVALKRGEAVNGSTENVVRFMNKLFFLSDDAAVTNFCRNPRPYLMPIKPVPPHHIFVIGPKYCGKTAVSKCLAYLFNCKRLEINALEEEYKNKKKLEYLEMIRTAAISEGLLALEQLREHEKTEKIHFWMTNTYALLKSEFPDLKSKVELVEPNETHLESQLHIDSDVSSDKSIASNISERTHSQIVIELEKINLPLSDKNKVMEFFEDKTKLLDYLPEDLQKPIKTPTVFDSYVTNYVNETLENTKIEDEPLTAEEIVDMFETAIKQLKNDSMDSSYGWVIDGFPPDLKIIKKLSADAIADEIICLRDEDPENRFLIEKFIKRDSTEFRGFKKFFNDLKRYSAADRVPLCLGSSLALIARASKLYSTTILDDAGVETETSEPGAEYVTHLQEFNQKWKEVKSYLTSVCTDPPFEINIANKHTPDILMECVLNIENHYRRTASVMTDEDKILEAKDFGGHVADAEEEEELGEEEPASNEEYLENRRYGNSNIYCPVALFDHFVLWKGRDLYTAQFEDKLYCLSSERALNDFVTNPRKYLTSAPAETLPPARICIVGPTGCGKSTLARRLAQNFGLFYIDFEKLILDAFDLDETQKIDDLISASVKVLNDNACIHTAEIDMLKQYLEGNALLPEYILKNILNPIWFDKPYKHIGFVLDNFPRKSIDIEYMTKNYYIPDTVIELHASQEEIHSRMFHLKMDAWQEAINERKRLKEIENANILRHWERERQERIDILVETVKEERKGDFIRSRPPVPPYSSPVDSTTALSTREEVEEEEDLNMFIYDPVQQLEDLEEIKRKVEQDLPRPVFDTVWESFEEASERTEAQIGHCFARDIGLLENVIVQLKNDNIEFVAFEAQKPAENLLNQVTIFVDKFKFRNRSFFERVYPITIDVAEQLLENGYYFLSKFGRICPVQIYEKINPIHMFLSAVHKMLIFPVIHRRYIYFICGSIHLDKFKQNPLLYVENEDYRLPYFPLRISIIGPPKSGKSALAEKFQKELGLKVITRGQAARYVLKNLSYCELAQNMNAALNKGWSLTAEMIAGAVEAVTLDGKSIAQGYVLDGFPNSVDEVKHLTYLGILPYVFLDVAVGETKIEECTSNEIGKKQMWPMSYEFIKFRYANWLQENIKMLTWIEKEYQNIYKIPKPDSKWQVWNLAKNIAFSNLFNILNYYKTRDLDLAFHMKSLLISPLEFNQKQSSFRNYCPCCLFYSNHLVTSGDIPDRNGLVQFRDHYYWICNEHFAQFMAHPQKFLPPHSEAMLPDNLPSFVGLGSEQTYQSGICIVTYWDSRPKTVVRYGSRKYSVFYNDACYLFCSEECMRKFLKEPHLYFDKVSHYRGPFTLQLKKMLPTMGYLEQYVASLLINAIVYTETVRPLHPCMNIETSAMMNIALYLKINNPKTNKQYLPFYEEHQKKFDERREKLKEFISIFTVTENPFLCFEDSFYA